MFESAAGSRYSRREALGPLEHRTHRARLVRDSPRDARRRTVEVHEPAKRGWRGEGEARCCSEGVQHAAHEVRHMAAREIGGGRIVENVATAGVHRDVQVRPLPILGRPLRHEGHGATQRVRDLTHDLPDPHPSVSRCDGVRRSEVELDLARGGFVRPAFPRNCQFLESSYHCIHVLDEVRGLGMDERCPGATAERRQVLVLA